MFFRNPERKIPAISDGTILSGADGVVIKIIEDAIPPAGYEDLKQKWKQISIFMRVYDVHANRVPMSGKLTRKIYTRGKFQYAAAKQADTDNERLSILIEGKYKIICQQVAGMLARRILCNAIEYEDLKIGDIYGFIQLGSRLDMFIPNELECAVKVGDKVLAGQTYIVQ